MPTINVPESKAKGGVKITTNQLTKIQVRLASIEILVGGPYGDHPYGHTALRVTTADLDQIYDYGRYGKTWGVGDSEGEGVLNVWNSFDAYIKEENSLGRITTGFVYDTAEADAKKIIDFYDQKISGKKPRRTTAVKKSFVIDDYYALGPNCTTLSVTAAKKVFPDFDRDWSRYRDGRGLGFMEKGIVSARGWPNYIFMPADLLAMLQAPTAKKAKAINKYGGKK